MRKIEVAEIRKGDKIRIEFDNYSYSAVEYVADGNMDDREWEVLSGIPQSTVYLLDRTFTPEWGMVIGDPNKSWHRAVYVPSDGDDDNGWLSSGELNRFWHDDTWAQAKMSEGWVEIHAPEDLTS